jgi:hypothetical protein
MLKPVMLVLVCATTLFAQAPAQSWLDKPFANWNTPGRELPRAVPDGETIAEVLKRCRLTLLRNTPGERALADAGWIPFHMFDRQISQRDVEIVGGMAGADGMCRAVDFNVYVFVGGRLAGTLSPADMWSRTDGSIGGAIRLAGDDTISAGFARYTDADPLCCPSSQVTVTYRIDRTARPPVVVPVSVRPTRQ